MVQLLREANRVPMAEVIRLVQGGTERDLLLIEAGSLHPTIDWVRAYSMATTATFTHLFDVWDRESPDPASRMTVLEAAQMVSRLMETQAGVECPCCGGKVVARKRTLNEPVASFVLWLVKSYTGTPINVIPWVDANPALSRGGTYARARHWGLAKREEGRDPLWSPTEHGKRWCWGMVDVHQHIVLHRNRVLRFEGKPVSFDAVMPGSNDGHQRGLGRTPSLPGLDAP